jgi:predicted enzyme related to lactoylglutathione lyase
VHSSSLDYDPGITTIKGAFMFLGLRTALYNAPELDHAKAWYSSALGIEPYFDMPFYVGFNVGGYELGLTPDPSPGMEGLGGNVAYWGVDDCAATFAHLIELGATAIAAIQDVGEGIKVATLRDPFGNALGIIENPNFKVS